MLFSIIVPTFNSENSIRRCLDSILSQSFFDFEIIVINDGSTDNTGKILNEYANIHSCVKVFNFANSGVGISRRKGISLAQGQYLIFVDSDDSINSNLLQELYNTILSFSYLPDIIRYQCNIINDNITKDHERYNFFATDDLLSGMDSLKQWSIPGKKYGVYWLFCFKKTVFTQLLFVPDLKCYEDVALIPLLIASSKYVVTINYVGYNYSYGNYFSLTNLKTKAAERSRAYDFFVAYDFAIRNFIKLDNITSSDIAFFISDYNHRLISKFNSLDKDLQKELTEMLASRVKSIF